MPRKSKARDAQNNAALVKGGVVRFPLTRGKWAIVDEEDWFLVKTYKWHTVKTSKGGFYASAHGDGSEILLHRLLMSPPAGMCVDHINWNGLDNRRINLRVCSYSQNQANRRGQKGVRKIKNRWVASICVNGDNIYLGSFTTKQKASNAYREARIDYFAEFAGD